MNATLRVIVLLALAGGAAFAADIQLKTADGQTLQGEHLGTRDGIVKLRTSFGVVNIPENKIVTITAIKSTEPAKEKKEEGAETAATFPEVKPPVLTQLVSKRLAGRKEPSYRKDERIELHRMVRNFAESSNASRQKIVRRLKDYGTTADPFIDAAYNEIDEIPEKVELLAAAAQPGRNLSVLLFLHAHDAAKAYMKRVADEPSALPPDYVSKRDRESPLDKADLLKAAAGYVLTVEGYASTAGGPLNALFLLDVYRKRYTSDEEDPLLIDLGRDKSRLAATGNDATRSKSAWTGEDRILLAELVFPWLFRDNADLKSLSQELLKKILPSGHPKWDAPEEDWVAWWEEAKEGLRK
ncbi:MAG TPA: hypothetical protein VEJ63_15660 [Planctomycetota bacterium]|nr:hypothetical protein [Planctomycetota bacterium]